MPGTRLHIDALFVINQDTSHLVIKRITARQGFRRVLLLSTHRLFENEKRTFKRVASGITFLTFAELLNDAEMLACDNRANDYLHHKRMQVHTGFDYMGQFIDRSLWYKNQTVYRNLSKRYSFGLIFVDRQLGIHQKFWHSIGARELFQFSAKTIRNFLAGLTRKLQQALRRRQLVRLADDNATYLFFSDLKRLKIAAHARPTSWKLPRTLWFKLLYRPKSAMAAIRESVPGFIDNRKPFVIATTIHDYLPQLHQLKNNLHVFVDGYHPSNYPRSYVDRYGDCTFVPNEMFGEQWFRKHGRQTTNPPVFIAPRQMQAVSDEALSPIRTLVLILNHAGDWSTLINRSDTDLLVETFCEAAGLFSGISFIIRPHPTMAIRAHEGIDSLKRINRFVHWQGKPNLEVSTATLAEDLARGQLFITEYSNVIIDVYSRGKPGLITNLTARRSFMQDFTELGFPAVQSQAELKLKIHEFVSEPAALCRQQTLAASRFNKLLKAWEETPEGHSSIRPQDAPL